MLACTCWRMCICACGCVCVCVPAGVSYNVIWVWWCASQLGLIAPHVTANENGKSERVCWLYIHVAGWPGLCERGQRKKVENKKATRVAENEWTTMHEMRHAWYGRGGGYKANGICSWSTEKEIGDTCCQKHTKRKSKTLKQQKDICLWWCEERRKDPHGTQTVVPNSVGWVTWHVIWYYHREANMKMKPW